MWLIRPLPRVSVMNSPTKPISRVPARVFEPRTCVTVDRHVGQFGAPRAQRLHDAALVDFVDIDRQRSNGSKHLAVDIFFNTCGLPTASS